jgi:hypothetical protein
MDRTGTHFPILAACVASTKGRVLELGCGDYSTPMLHFLCKGRPLVSIDTDAKWLARFEDLKNPDHVFHLAVDFGSVALIDEGLWVVTLIDHAPALRRVVDIRRLMHRSKFLVVHDTEDLGYGYEAVLPEFKFRHDYKRWDCWTTVVSMYEKCPFL